MGFIKKYLLAFIALSTCLSLMAGCTASSTTPPAVNGEEPTTYQLGIDLLGTKSKFQLDSQGRLKTEVKLSSADDRVSLSLNEDTISLDKDGMPLQAIDVAIDLNPPPPPEGANIVGAVYDFKPQGANFNPFITLTIGYTPKELLEGTRESNLYVGCYVNGQWSMLRYKNLDTESHRVTTLTDRFGKYAVLAPVTKREEPASGVPSAPADRVDIVYFHRTNRCYSCIYAEDMTRHTIETYFEEELNSGELTFKSVDVQDDSNAAIIDKYDAYGSQLSINAVRSDTEHIEHVIEIWEFLGNDEAFSLVVRNKVIQALEEIE